MSGLALSHETDVRFDFLRSAGQVTEGTGKPSSAFGVLSTTNTISTSTGPVDVKIADLNGDGKTELVVVGEWMPVTILPLTFVLLLFPDGRLPSPRWRPVAWAAGLGLATYIVTTALHPRPPIEPIPLRSEGVGKIGAARGTPKEGSGSRGSAAGAERAGTRERTTGSNGAGPLEPPSDVGPMARGMVLPEMSCGGTTATGPFGAPPGPNGDPAGSRPLCSCALALGASPERGTPMLN